MNPNNYHHNPNPNPNPTPNPSPDPDPEPFDIDFSPPDAYTTETSKTVHSDPTDYHTNTMQHSGTRALTKSHSTPHKNLFMKGHGQGQGQAQVPPTTPSGSGGGGEIIVSREISGGRTRLVRRASSNIVLDGGSGALSFNKGAVAHGGNGNSYPGNGNAQYQQVRKTNIHHQYGHENEVGNDGGMDYEMEDEQVEEEEFDPMATVKFFLRYCRPSFLRPTSPYNMNHYIMLEMLRGANKLWLIIFLIQVVKYDSKTILEDEWDALQKQNMAFLEEFAKDTIANAYDIIFNTQYIYHQLVVEASQSLVTGVSLIEEEERKHEDARRIITDFSNEMKRAAEVLKKFGGADSMRALMGGGSANVTKS
nr:uncharacterized protein CI109_005787 [Kwoniella shandongensis]KAA5525905.1 hypothetical protein CI109_005787 [Kwoniella shandongensis]